MKKKVIGLLAVFMIIGGIGAASFFNSQETVELKAAGVATVTFKTTAEYPFDTSTNDDLGNNNPLERTILVDKEALETMDIPLFQNNSAKSFTGWQAGDISLAPATADKHVRNYDDMTGTGTVVYYDDFADGSIYQTYEILRKAYYEGDSITYTAVASDQGVSGSDILENDTGSSYSGIEESTSTRMSESVGQKGVSASGVFVYPNPDNPASGTAKSFANSNAGFLNAVYDLFSQGDLNTDYVIYIGSNLGTTSLGNAIGAKTEAGDVTSSSDVSFYSLKGKIKSLTITGRTSTTPANDDPINDTAGTALAAGQVTFPAVVNFGTNIEIRNLGFRGASTIASNGYSMYIGGGVYSATGTTFYGGSADGTNVTAQPGSQVSISSTGLATQTWNVFGGSSGGTFTGSTDVIIKDSLTTSLNTVYGGSSAGTVTGDTKVTVTSTKSVSSVFGGSEAGSIEGNSSVVINKSAGSIAVLCGGSNTGSVIGNVNVAVKSAAAITTLYGGTNSGTVSGKTDVAIGTTGTITNLYGTNTGKLQQGASVALHNSSAVGTLSPGASGAGTIDGDTSLIINGAAGTIGTIYGGTNGGTLNGNVKVLVNDARQITNYYGASNSGTVNGNIANRIRVANSSTNLNIYTSFHGGANSGTINGSIETLIAGYGRMTPANWYGGSASGNIGSDASRQKITNIYDTSLYVSGNPNYIGGNESTGIVYAAITNTVRAAVNYDSGSLYSVNGATGGAGSAQTAVSASNVDGFASPSARAERAKNGTSAANSAKLQTIGDLDTHILGGLVSIGGGVEAGFAHATGRNGYFEGDAIIKVGILNSDDSQAGGYNYCYSYSSRNVTDLIYRVSPSKDSVSANRTENSGWDIFGGPCIAADGTYAGYVYGNANTVINNALARWTYGGGYYGVIDGNTSHTMNGGLVDTLEGAGYTTQRIFGNTTAYMHNGEINFFFSGGGWNDVKIDGNVAAYCTGGFINAPIGGSYGADLTTGNAKVHVTGGNFSGMNNPSHGDYQGFSGGSTQSGTIQGDIELTLDLRETTGFQLPKGINITGGNPQTGSGIIGTSAKKNVVTLNIYTKEGDTDVLNGAVIYGDGGDATRSLTEQININIDAPGSTIGAVVATSYANRVGTASSGSRYLLRDVNINVQNAADLGTLSGGGASYSSTTGAITSLDTIDNTMNANSLSYNRGVDVILGSDAVLPDSPVDDSEPISFTKGGLINFTSLRIENGKEALASGGNIKNGADATASNHYNTYNTTGHVTVEHGSGFGVNTESNFISVGDMTLIGESNVYSPPGTGKINLTSLTFNNHTDSQGKETTGRLTWHKTGTGNTTVSSKGNYFGTAQAFQVLTFNPTINNAKSVDPFNFMGIDDATGKTYVGDSDTTTGAGGSGGTLNGWGIMIPGSVVDFNVEGDYDPADLEELLSNGMGLISYDTNEKDPIPNIHIYDPENPSAPASAVDMMATLAENEQGVSGRLVIPILSSSNSIYPTLTFDPDNPTASWIRKVTIDATETTGAYDEVISEKDNSDSADWTMGENTNADANQYSYMITAVFSNQAELSGKHVIITHSQAQALANKAAVQSAQNVEGRPFLVSNLSTADLALIQKGLDLDESGEVETAEEVNLVYVITYTANDADHVDHLANPVVNSETGTYNLVIVPDDSEISANKDFALFAKNASLLLYEAQNLSGQTELDGKTKAVVYYADNSPNGTASLASSYIDTIKAAASAATVPITYKAVLDSTEIEKAVNIEITGALILSQAPDLFDFGTHETSMVEQTHWAQRKAGTDPTRGWTELVVTDTRGDGVEWTLSVKESQTLKDATTNLTLANCLYYVDNTNAGSEIEQVLSGSAYNVIVNKTNGSIPASDYQKDYTVTNDWEEDEKGIKLKVPFSKQIVGTYDGELEWTLTFEP